MGRKSIFSPVASVFFHEPRKTENQPKVRFKYEIGKVDDPARSVNLIRTICLISAIIHPVRTFLHSSIQPARPVQALRVQRTKDGAFIDMKARRVHYPLILAKSRYCEVVLQHSVETSSRSGP